jgi:transcriptional regulator of acetoin/glycerol metabolism
MLNEHHHRSRIDSVLSNASSAPFSIESYITHSWIRCSNEYKLDPTVRAEPHVVERSELLDRQDKLSNVLTASKAEMANLFQQIAGSGYAIMLTDAEGVLLNYFGDPSFTHAASKSGMMPGAVWSEQFQGTNGMGTCLLEKRPMMVHQHDHYLFRNTGLTCAAAPIFGTDGEVLAVLDASGEAHLAPEHVLDLVNMSVQTIENKIFMHEFADRRFVRFHSRPEFVGTLAEGILAIDENDKLVGATRNAQSQLGLRGSQVNGRSIEEFFNVSFESLIREAKKCSNGPSPIFDARYGRRFFASAIETGRTGIFPGAAIERRNNACGSATPVEMRRTPLEQLHFGRDPVMEHNVKSAMRVLDRDVAMLLYGETGTGKELFAKAVHLSSQRAKRPFVAINCASIPESLIESELFGYKSGAFTGANKEGQRGKIFQANGGTLFLDEIGDMPVQLQARLLRVLEEREVIPLGSETPIKIDIRLISATHCDLLEKIDKNEFREDLYYRLQGLTLTMPPLRDRGDRRALIQYVLKQEQPDDTVVVMDSELLNVLERYRWPGNIRQLRNMMRTMVALRNCDVLTLADLSPEFRPSPDRPTESSATSATQDSGLNPLESAEREALLQELKRSRWNISTVAKQLKISRNTLYRKLERLDIDLAHSKQALEK